VIWVAAAAVGGAMAGGILGACLRGGPRLASVDRRVRQVLDEVSQLHAAHSDHQATLDRRLRDVEQASAMAAGEVRIVSVQLAGDTGLQGRVSRIENRLGLRRPLVPLEGDGAG
jgi:hypothetical protein